MRFIRWVAIPLLAAAASTLGASPVPEETGDLLARVRSIVQRMPGSGSGGFVKPSPAEIGAFREALARLADRDVEGAQVAVEVGNLPYRIVPFADSGSDGRSLLLLEESGPTPRGWGTYILDAAPRTGLVLEVPHVRYDIDTEAEGVEVFRRTRAQALLLAGCHRCASPEPTPCSGRSEVCGGEGYKVSDAAHFTASFFQAAHEELSTRWPGSVAVSLHGHSDSSCEDVFLSSGVAWDPGPLLPPLREALLESGRLTAGAAGVAASACDLVGSSNVQGRHSNGSPDPCLVEASSASGRFLHVEQARRVRSDASLTGILVDALLKVVPRLEAPPGRRSVRTDRRRDP